MVKKASPEVYESYFKLDPFAYGPRPAPLLGMTSMKAVYCED